MALNKEKQDREVEQNSKTTSQFRLQAATRLHEVGIASNRGSACRCEYVPGPCYDFTPITSFTFGDVLLAVRLSTSGPDVYKRQRQYQVLTSDA